MTIFTWKIDQMYTLSNVVPDYVVNTLWTLTGDQDGIVAFISGGTQFAPPANADGSFTPYDQLTQEQVIGWVQDALGPDGVANYEANVQGQIDSILNPPVSPQNTPLPWSSEAQQA